MTRSSVNFHANSWKSENLHLMVSFCWKDIVLHEKVQKSYFSWHWRVMQSLKKNWLLVSKMTWQMKSDGNFEERLTFCFKNDARSLMYFNSSSEKSEHLNFDRIYLSKVYRWVVSWKMINGLKNDIYKKFGQFSHKYLKVMLDKSSAYNVLAEEMYFSDQCIPLNFNFLDFPVLVWSYPNPSYDFWNREPVFV